MNYTENYHLPQWDETDRIMRTDFNQMCADMESGMTANARAAEQAAELPYVVGSYTGDGAEYREIITGFRPRFVLICSDQRVASQYYGGLAIAMAGPTVHSTYVYMMDNGFRLRLSEGINDYPKVNQDGKAYDYIAFR